MVVGGGVGGGGGGAGGRGVEEGRTLGSGRMDTYPEYTRLDFNRTIFTTAVKINGVMFAARVVLGGFIDVGDSIEIRIVNLKSSEEHVLQFSEDDMKKIAGLEEREGGVIRRAGRPYLGKCSSTSSTPRTMTR